MSAACRGVGGQQLRGARLPLGRMLAIARMQVVVAAARVRVDEQQALVLARERAQDFEQQHVLVDVGEVAGVILVAIFHGTPASRRARLYTVCATEQIDVEGSAGQRFGCRCGRGIALPPAVCSRRDKPARRGASRRRRAFPIPSSTQRAGG